MKTIFINGLSGKMGKTINNLILNDPDFEIVKTVSDSDVVIDFSYHVGSAGNAERMAEWGVAWIIGTTGYTEDELIMIDEASKKIPIVRSGNMSLGINLLMYLTEIASSSLGKNFLSKIFEVHHKHKKDYPSGTALMLGKGIAVGKNKNFEN